LIKLGEESGVISLWYNIKSTEAESNNEYELLISTTDRNFSSFSIKYYRIESSETWVQRSIDITEYKGQEIYFAFRHFGENRNSTIMIDEIMITHICVSDDDLIVELPRTGIIGNFPNPFNPETTIQFSVFSEEYWGDGSTHVEINIYNIRGQLVRRLVSEEYSAGNHDIVWNGKDDNGTQVGSGVYFYRFIVGDFVETRRMMLLK